MLNHLFMNALTAMLLLDPHQNRLIKVNQAADDLFNLNGSDLSNFSVTQFFPSCLDKLLNFTQQILEQKTAWSCDLSLMLNNELIPLDVNARVLDEYLLFSCQKRDVTFGRYFQSIVEANYQSGFPYWNKNETVFEEIERQNQLLLTAVGDGIYGVDVDGNTTFVNVAAEKIIGWKV